MYYILPHLIGTHSIQDRNLGFVGSHHESSMFEGDNISRLWIPSLCKLCCSCWCYKSNPIRPSIAHKKCKIEIMERKNFRNVPKAQLHIQFTLPATRSIIPNDFRFSIAIFLLSYAWRILWIYFNWNYHLPCVWGIHSIDLIEKDLKDLARWFLLLLDPWYPEISSQDDLFLHIMYRKQLW